MIIAFFFIQVLLLVSVFQVTAIHIDELLDIPTLLYLFISFNLTLLAIKKTTFFYKTSMNVILGKEDEADYFLLKRILDFVITAILIVGVILTVIKATTFVDSIISIDPNKFKLKEIFERKLLINIFLPVLYSLLSTVFLFLPLRIVCLINKKI